MPINLDSSLSQGILRDLDATWKNAYPVFEKENAVFAHKLADNNIRSAKYAWKESVPFPKPWDYQRGRSHQAFRDRDITVNLRPFDGTIDVHGRDRDHDQLGDTRSHIELMVKRFLQLPQKLYHEYLNGAASLNASLANAYDGAALYATTDGAGAARFGVTNGNLLSGSGTGVADFANDLFRVQEQMLGFLDPAGEIVYSPQDLEFSKFHVVVPRQLNEVANKVCEVEFLRSDLGNNTSEGNFFKGKFKLHVSNLLTDSSDWFVFVEHQYWKSFVYRQFGGPRSFYADMSNSDRAREHYIESLFTDQEVGVGVWAPFVTCKVNN